MTSRERVQAAVTFNPPDQLPKDDAPWSQTVDRWRREGLPVGVEVEDFFQFDICSMFIDASPRFEMNILDRSGGRITYEDRSGYTIRKIDGVDSSMQFLDHKNKNRDTWEKIIKPRMILSPDEPARIDDQIYFGHFDPYPSWEESARKYKDIKNNNRYLLFDLYGPWEAAWRHRGMEKLLMDLLMYPDWVEDMAKTHLDLTTRILDHCLKLDMKPDGIMLTEDLGSKNGPLFSTETWNRIFQSHFHKLGEYLKSNGIAFWMHSCGMVEPHLDRIIETGVQVLNPLEAKAGMDAVKLRKRYGNNLAFYGNIDVQKMAGPKDQLERELQRKVPLAINGGYILHSDHSVPP